MNLVLESEKCEELIDNEYMMENVRDNRRPFLNPQRLFRFWKAGIFFIAIAAHIIIILTVTIDTSEKKEREDNTIFKMVDIQEIVPLPPQPEKKPEPLIKPPPPEEKLEITMQDNIAEEIIVVDEEVIESADITVSTETIDFLPQHKISVPPVIPSDEILANVKYPALANMQGIEGVVFLELYIDQFGQIRNIKVLKDPGYGLAEAAVAAFEGIFCKPAFAEETAVAVRYRYPVRFQLK